MGPTLIFDKSVLELKPPFWFKTVDIVTAFVLSCFKQDETSADKVRNVINFYEATLIFLYILLE